MRNRNLLWALAACIGGEALAHGVTPVERIDVTATYENAVGLFEAASQGTITPSLIDTRPIANPGSVIELVPGVVATQHSGPGKANQYFLRGFNLDHGSDFATSVVGMPVNLPSHAHGQGYADLNFLIPELISRIDYRKGPYFVSNGDFASAGAADIRYFDALKNSVVELTAGRWESARAFAAGTRRAGPGLALGALEVERGAGPWTRGDDLRKLNAVLTLAGTGPESKWKAAVMAYRGTWNATDQVPERAIDRGDIGRFDTIDPTDGGRSSRYSASFEHWQRMGDAMLRTSAYAIRYSLDLFSNFTYFLDDPVRGDQFEQREKRTVLGGDMNWERQVTLWGSEGTQALGIQLRHDRVAPLGLYRTIARERVTTVSEDRVGQSSLGLYAEQGLSLALRWRALAGVRYDRQRFAVDSDSGASASREAGIFSPKFTLVGGPWAKTEVFFNAGHGFHSNDARGVTRSAFDPGAPSADPLVKTRGEEIGVRSEWIPRTQLSLALWRLALGSELVFVGDAGTTEATRASRRRGVEASARVRPLPWLSFDFDASFSRARFADDDPAGPYIPGAVERVLSGGVTARHPGDWTAGFLVRHYGPRPLTEDGTRRSSSATLANAHFSFVVRKAARITLDVFNVFDRKASDIEYFYASRLRGEPAPVADIHLHPVQPRHARVTLQVRF